MFIMSRSVSVIGRMMKVEMSSIGVTMMYTGHGTPEGKSEFLKKFFGALLDTRVDEGDVRDDREHERHADRPTCRRCSGTG